MVRFYQIIWVDATSTETIELSLRDIAGDPEAKAQNVGDSTESVLQWLSRRDGECLIVFDDANADITKYIPSGNRGNILFTSHDIALRRYVPDEAFAKVEDMDEEDAISLLLKSAFLDGSRLELREAARPIVKELLFLPLAVDQAGASIANGSCCIDDYLRMYSQHHQELLDDPTFKGASNYNRTAYRTWNVSLTVIKAQMTEAAVAAISILQIFSFIHHENISEEIMKRAAEALKTPSDDEESQKMKNNLSYRLLQCDKDGHWDPFYFRKGIQTLVSFSLIKKAVMDNIYSMHPLVHSWSRDSMAHEEQQAGSFFVHSLLSSSITFVFANEDYAFCRTLVPHIKAVDRHDAVLRTPMGYNDERYTNYGLVFYEAGYWKEAEQLRVQVSETRKKVLGEEHPDTLTSMAHLASTYRNQGRWKEAEQLDVQVMETTKTVLGEEHPHTLTNMGNLAWTYLNQGWWKEAEQLFVQVLETTKRVLGEEHPDTLTSMANLASTYRKQGWWKEAEQLEVQVLEMRKRVIGEEHPDTLMCMGNLTSTYCNQGRWKEAEQLFVQVLETIKRVLGEEHPDTLMSMGNLASTYWNQGRWKEAEQLEVQVLEMRKRVLGEEHPHTLMSMGNLASTYSNQGQWKEAEQLEVQVLETIKRVLREEHPDTLMSMGNLASTYLNQGWWKEAEQLEVQVSETRKRVLREEHPHTLTSMANLASMYRNQRWWKEAEQLDVQVLETRKRVLREEHPHTLTSMGNLASKYRNQGWWKEAEHLDVKVSETRKRILVKEHLDNKTP